MTEIPNGPYCYRHRQWPRMSHELGILHVEPCPHWQKTDGGARCNLINLESDYGDPFNLLWDRVKECGINCD